MEQEQASRVATALCDWFDRERRRLPWRIDPTPYRVWVSEIMLQQTRIEAVIPYFERFMAECPTVRDLAAISDDRLMKLWEGLGYYSRARNLKKAANQIVERHDGALPPDYEALKALAGIGEYTAGAIASIAFRLPVPAVDGNVLRVLARLTACREDVLKGQTKKELTALAASMVPADRPDAFNQALMELGERVCLPNTMPHCADCPIAKECKAAGSELAASLPVRSPKKARRREQKTVLVLLTNEETPRVLLHKRADNGLLAGLWELPNAEGHGEWCMPFDGVRAISDWLSLPAAKHVFSHIEWDMRGALAVVAPCALPEGYEWADLHALQTHRALPTAFRAYSQMLPTWLSPSDRKG